MAKRRRTRAANSSAAGREAPLVFAGLLVIVGPQLLGGAPAWSVPLIAALAGLGCLAGWWVARAEGRSLDGGPVALVLTIVVAWTAVQAMPLPIALVEVLQPESAQHVTRTAWALGVGEPGWASLSLDPGTTRREIIEIGALCAAFVLGTVLAAQGRRRAVLYLVCASVVLMAVVALGHELAGADKVYGLYEPSFTRPPVLAPLLNSNHLGGYLAMGVPLLVAFGVRARGPTVRAVWLVAAAVVSATMFLCLSRGAMAVWFGGLVLFGWLALWRRRAGAGRGSAAVAVAAAVAIGVVFAAYVALAPILEQWTQESGDKIRLLQEGAGVAIDHPWVGVGKGGMSVAMVARFGTQWRYEYSENLLVQWTSEWGIPVAVLLLIAVGVALGRALVGGGRSVVALGAAVGALGLFMQNMVDYSIELPAVGAVVFVVLGAVAPSSKSPKGTRAAGRLRARLPMAGLVAAAAVLVPVVLIGFQLPSQAAVRADLEAGLRDGDRVAFQRDLRRATALHPAEPVVALLAAAEASAAADPAAPRWMNRAMELAPEWDAPHVEAARWLLHRGRVGQAMLELGVAAELAPHRVSSVLCQVIRRTEDPELVLRSAPSGGNRHAFLDLAARCLPATSPFTRRIDEALISDDSRSGGALERSARRALSAGDHGDALEMVDEALRADGEDLELRLLRVRILIEGGRTDQALAVLDTEQYPDSARWAVESLRARAHAETGDEAAVRGSVDRLRGLARGRAGKLAEAMRLLGRLESQMGNGSSALHAYEEAFRFSQSANDLRQVVASAEALGDLRRAFRAAADGCRLQPNGALCDAERRLGRRLGAEP